jgi:hypothetical protein
LCQTKKFLNSYSLWHMLPTTRQLFTFRKTILSVMFVVVLFGLCFSGVPDVLATAQTDSFGVIGLDTTTGLSGMDIRITIARIIRAAFAFLGTIALVLVLYGGYTIMTSAGAEDKVTNGKKILINATIGLAIILSAFAIVQFVISRLDAATRDGFGTGVSGIGSGIQRNTFAGSGALGRVIRDHYPVRNQRGVVRNTKIAITFNEPVDPSSVIVDWNRNNIIGDCINLGTPTFDWGVDCDRANTSSVKLSRKGTPTTTIEMATLATYEDGGAVMNYTFRPIELLGDSTGDVGYNVNLTSAIRKGVLGQVVDIVSAFFGLTSQRYEWFFETSTLLDVTPPTVESKYPSGGGAVPRNTILQITFSEPVDPSLVQGKVDLFSAFTNIIFSDTSVTGEWKLTNGYRTVEFVSDIPCGQNSCGDTRYCILVNCTPRLVGGTCIDSHNLLLRTANLISPSSFESIPGSGIMDMAGNALDGDADGRTDGKPTPLPDLRQIRLPPNGVAPYESQADNHFWMFSVSNIIDDRVPYVEQMFPGIDEEGVPSEAPMKISFSMPMWYRTFGGVTLEEWWGANVQDDVEPIWYMRNASSSETRTELFISHREFGPNDEDAYYFTGVSSTVRAINQDCLYPGRGPNGNKNSSPVCNYQLSASGVVTVNTGCTAVGILPSIDTSCVQSDEAGQIVTSSIRGCERYMRNISQ